MRKSLILLSILIVLLTSMSCSKDEIFLRPSESFKLSFDLGLPSLTSKVPTCKPGNPDRIAYSVTNARNEEFVYYGDIQEINGRYRNANEIELPTGNYTINSIELIQGNDALYAVPDQSDGTILHYANLILPIDITLNENVNISGTAFCFDQIEPDFNGVINGDYDTLRLESLFFQVLDIGCTDMITVTIDAYRVPEVTIFEAGIYEVAIPKDYQFMSVRSYDEDGMPLDGIYEFTNANPYTSDTLLIFDNDCN